MNLDRMKARAAEALRDGGIFAKFYAEDVPALIAALEKRDTDPIPPPLDVPPPPR